MMLVFGQSGQVAHELAALKPDARFLSRKEADLSDPERCAAIIAELEPDVVINAAAYTAVDKAESEEGLAEIVNGQAPAAMARVCAAITIPFVHISTDYVFDGSGNEAWRPDDIIAPINAYGRSKAMGEAGVRDSGATHAILRTSWVFSPHGNNFVKTMLRLAKDREQLSIVGDQVGGPTPARAIAEACLVIADRLRADPTLSGTYHFSGAPDVSWADFARTIFQEAGRSVRVTDIATSEFPTPASRPGNSRLDCASLDRFGLTRPQWRDSLRDIIEGQN